MCHRSVACYKKKMRVFVSYLTIFILGYIAAQIDFPINRYIIMNKLKDTFYHTNHKVYFYPLFWFQESYFFEQMEIFASFVALWTFYIFCLVVPLSIVAENVSCPDIIVQFYFLRYLLRIIFDFGFPPDH